MALRPVLALVVLVAGGCASTVDWNRKDAHRHCKGAIAAWPKRESPPCSALHRCANEAVLSAAENDKLLQMIRAATCEEP